MEGNRGAPCTPKKTGTTQVQEISRKRNFSNVSSTPEKKLPFAKRSSSKRLNLTPIDIVGDKPSTSGATAPKAKPTVKDTVKTNPTKMTKGNKGKGKQNDGTIGSLDVAGFIDLYDETLKSKKIVASLGNIIDTRMQIFKGEVKAFQTTTIAKFDSLE